MSRKYGKIRSPFDQSSVSFACGRSYNKYSHYSSLVSVFHNILILIVVSSLENSANREKRSLCFGNWDSFKSYYHFCTVSRKIKVWDQVYSEQHQIRNYGSNQIIQIKNCMGKPSVNLSKIKTAQTAHRTWKINLQKNELPNRINHRSN